LTTRPFQKLLIANRGEIACRIMRTAARLGIRTVAVYSDADRQAQHVAQADEAVFIGAAPARESYLLAERILQAARTTGAEAVHPGYGFLSENDGFADACAQAGLIFIGPSGDSIRAMGSKSAAKTLMERSGVPLVPGYHGAAQDLPTLAAAAMRIGYPVLIKASAGGGGKGMRVAPNPEIFAALVSEAKREAASAFGDDHVLIEKYLQRPRHIEVQIFGDTHGHVVSLLERECTLQRRHQKVVEEAPSASIDADRREQLAAAARAAAKAVAYVGAGTVEFVANADGFYFIEMNTRLQVEHPVTEMITGIDLVEWQLRVAAGEALPLAQAQITGRGHAVEVRIYAEDPERDFMPSIGQLAHWRQPEISNGVRVDTGFAAGDTVSPHYDPMLAKLIVWAEDRPAALARMGRALTQFEVVGVTTNLNFLQRLVTNEAVIANDIDTNFIERALDTLTHMPGEISSDVLAVAAAAVLVREAAAITLDPADPHSPWNLRHGWAMTAERRRRLSFRDVTEHVYDLEVLYTRQGLLLVLPTGSLAFSYALGESLDVFLDGRKTRARSAWLGADLALWTVGGHYRFTQIDPYATDAAVEVGSNRIAAPMPGVVTGISAEINVLLERQAPVLTLEAMKVVHTLKAPSRGRITRFRCAVGDSVPEGIDLADFEPEAAES
jgi:3-methylcrotonyl-CoA carboxylase alpha subunit